MSSTLRNVGRAIPVTEDAQDSPVTLFRERIAMRNAEHAQAFPRAAALEALCLFRLHEEINGEATNLRGVRSAQGFRSALLGEKNINLSDLCRLATEPTRESRAAVKSVIEALGAVMGYRLEASHPEAPAAYEALAGVVEAGGEFGSAMSRRLMDDGIIDQGEARELRPGLEKLKAKVAHAEAVISKAERSA